MYHGAKNYVVPLNTVYQSQFTSLYKEIQEVKLTYTYNARMELMFMLH